MNRFIVVCSSALLCGPLNAATADTDGALAQAHAIDEIFKPWSSPRTPGCALSVERKGEPLLTRSYGAADLEHDVPVTATTIFEAGSVSKQLAHQIANLFLAAQPPPPSITLTAAQLTLRAGLFVDSRMGLPMRLAMREDSLNFGERQLDPMSAQEFRLGASTLRFFGLDRFVLQSLDGDELEYRRVQPWAPNQAELAALSGRYTSDEALATYRVSVIKDGGMVLRPQDRQGQPLTLRPIFADTFEWGEGGDGVVHFSRDAQNRVSGFEMSDERIHALAFRRISDTGSAN
jgi:hypothetical protein